MKISINRILAFAITGVLLLSCAANKNGNTTMEISSKGFVAEGNKSWLLSYDSEEGVNFNSYDKNKVILKGVELNEIAVNDKYRSYKASNSKFSLEVTLYNEKCANLSHYKVKVLAKNKSNNLEEFYEGCGANYEGNLVGKWTLKQSVTNPKGVSVPFIVFYPLNQKFTGNGGCNRIFGSYVYANKQVTFSKVGSTRMFCNDDNRENTFLKRLNGGLMAVDFKSETEIEFFNDEVVLQFQKK